MSLQVSQRSVSHGGRQLGYGAAVILEFNRQLFISEGAASSRHLPYRGRWVRDVGRCFHKGNDQTCLPRHQLLPRGDVYSL
ncbi:hypothetical protein E2C01_080112 [Portunus trituberculatus]|uniref:Uncharacterized protein n=1 Tax=Portunus trituberculatus TaxID=210409 RepID=A0A5B7INE9_PORTR|nr:hypothetical protein [Portunus trituberculatus]